MGRWSESKGKSFYDLLLSDQTTEHKLKAPIKHVHLPAAAHYKMPRKVMYLYIYTHLHI